MYHEMTVIEKSLNYISDYSNTNYLYHGNYQLVLHLTTHTSDTTKSAFFFLLLIQILTKFSACLLKMLQKLAKDFFLCYLSL